MRKFLCICICCISYYAGFSQNITFDKKRALFIDYSKDSIVELYKNKLIEKYKCRIVVSDYAKINCLNGDRFDRVVSYEVMTNDDYQPMYVDIISFTNGGIDVIYTTDYPVYGDGMDNVQQVGVDWIDNKILVVDYYFQNSNQDYECIKSFYFTRKPDGFNLFKTDIDLINYAGHSFSSKYHLKDKIYFSNYVSKIFPQLANMMKPFDVKKKY